MTSIFAQGRLQHEQVQYLEFLSRDINTAKSFYSTAFNWKFTDYGPDYTAFEGAYVDGGFTTGEPAKGTILVVLYSANLAETREKVGAAGATITREIFEFPGGRRFQFIDPDGYELAVWSE
ncbi:glyoxalase family protein [Pedobacter yulinensis]|uniref:Glyoxalase family protein n=1 Tax=Pedobacter yulinensis TaxID=2126353 RepID=A0A2T3HPE9_9SPHI|nr:VOC family protein [Pedobacter yulinensis]PST84306.1 glyoxalase family protein [Pedobacter yulinensis]